MGCGGSKKQGNSVDLDLSCKNKTTIITFFNDKFIFNFINF